MGVMRRSKGLAVVLAAFILALPSTAAAQATATVAGTVKDTQGGIIPGATVTLISETRGTTFDAQSTETGDYIFPNIPGDTYTVRVAMDGFKTTERKGVAVSPGDRVAVPAFTIEVGTLAETVLVTSDAPIIQAQTGERSFTVAREAVDNLPVTGRYFGFFAALVPGVAPTSSNRPVRLDGARTNYMLDGVTTINTGGNQPGLELNSDSIAEVRVVASAYQAEYGRSTGIQVIGVTKSGTNQFRGSVYDIERDSDWNSNTWANIRNGNPKTVSKQRDWGFTIGGPVGRAGGQNKLFFFYSEQFQPRTAGGAISRFRVPTLLERQGDFSQTTDNTGARFNLIRDSSTGLPCTSTDTRGCFQDGGVLGRIPQSRLYPLGLNILGMYPEPNVQGLNYNLETVTPNLDSNTYQHVIRADYQVSSRLRLSAKYAGQNATVQPTYPTANNLPNSIPGFNDRLFKYPAQLLPSATAVYTLNTSTILEGTWGYTRGNQLGTVPISPASNRCNVGLCDLPLLYPNIAVIPGSYQEKVLVGSEAPAYVNGQLLMTPIFQWGSRIANAPPNNEYPPFLNWQYTNDVAISVTKLWGSHTFKAGYQSQDSLKVQQLGTITAGALPFEGRINFANDSNNPLDAGFGYANAALGIFSRFEQQSAMLEGRYVYHNKDFFIQDNWKVNDRLTLDLGMRFTHHGPQYDEKQQSSNFFPDQWSASRAPLLYVPGCTVATRPCPGANRVAMNPETGALLGAGSVVAIGAIVPNSGTLLNGIVKAGDGIAKENYQEDPLIFGPRIGAAYDLSGTQSLVVRGSVGVFYDRTQGDAVFGQIGNPPSGQGSTVVNSTLQSLTTGSTLQPPPVLLVHNYDAKVGASTQWNAGVQMTLPFASSLDVSYVGVHNYNSVAFGSIGTPGGMLPIDLNAPDLGTAYLPQYQDPTLAVSAIPGASALPENLLRPYRGLGSIVSTWPRFYNRYDSIQLSYNRRYRNGWQGGMNYTWGIRNKGNTQSPPHLQHNADGTIVFHPEQDRIDEIMSNVGLQDHVIKGHLVWDLPNIDRTDGAWKVIRAAANDWQLSGIFTGATGAPYDAVYSYQTNGANVNLTGSSRYQARIRVVGDPGSGCSSNQYAQFNVAAFAGPGYGSIGDESGRNLLNGCFDHTTDLSIARNVRIGGTRQIQFRLDVFNAFNAVVINNRNTTMQLSSPANPTTITNNQFLADGSINPARLKPVDAGFGAATSAQSLRTVQMQLRFMF